MPEPTQEKRFAYEVDIDGVIDRLIVVATNIADAHAKVIALQHRQHASKFNGRIRAISWIGEVIG